MENSGGTANLWGTLGKAKNVYIKMMYPYEEDTLELG